MPDSTAEATVTLSRSLYDPEATRMAARSFARLAEIEVQVEETDLVVRFRRIHPKVADRIVDHFCNHALARTIEAARRP